MLGQRGLPAALGHTGGARQLLAWAPAGQRDPSELPPPNQHSSPSASTCSEDFPPNPTCPPSLYPSKSGGFVLIWMLVASMILRKATPGRIVFRGSDFPLCQRDGCLPLGSKGDDS